MFFERACPICRRPSPIVCASCWGRLEPAPVRWLASPEPGTARDLEVRSVFLYSEAVAAVVLSAKNGGRRSLLRQLGAAMAHEASGLHPFDAVTWVPASSASDRRRGFDQGRFLARTLAATLAIPARACLARPPGAAGLSGQKGKGRIARLERAALVATRPLPGRILLVDDVITTGASLRRGADALLAAGTSEVVAITAASSDRRFAHSSRTSPGLPSQGRDHA